MNIVNNWSLAYASVAGTSHIDDCQDACAVYELPGGQAGLALVADGAGSARFAAEGAKATIASAYYQIQKHWACVAHSLHHQPPDATVWRKFIIDIFKSIRTDICQKYSLELSNKLATEVAPNDLAATLQICIFANHYLLFARVGDGRLGYCDGSGIWQGVLPPLKGEYANMTTFISSNDWVENSDLIGSCVIPEPVQAFCLLSDGCERAAFEYNIKDHTHTQERYYDPNRPFDGFFNPSLQTLKILHEKGYTQAQINELWATFLKNGNQVLAQEPDDKTIVLGMRL